MRGDVGELLELGVRACQFIGLFQQSHLGALTFGDVEQEGAQTSSASVCIADALLMNLHDYRTAIAPFVFALQRNQGLIVGDTLQQTGAGLFAVFGGHKIPNGVSNHLFSRESKQVALGLIDAENHSIAIHFVTGDGRVLKPAFEMPLAVVDSLLQALTIEQLK